MIPDYPHPKLDIKVVIESATRTVELNPWVKGWRLDDGTE
jgi:hypothetical protein